MYDAMGVTSPIQIKEETNHGSLGLPGLRRMITVNDEEDDQNS